MIVETMNPRDILLLERKYAEEVTISLIIH